MTTWRRPMTAPHARTAHLMHHRAPVGASRASQARRGQRGQARGTTPAVTKPVDGPATVSAPVYPPERPIQGTEQT
jgi:hypothetical protein